MRTTGVASVAAMVCGLPELYATDATGSDVIGSYEYALFCEEDPSTNPNFPAEGCGGVFTHTVFHKWDPAGPGDDKIDPLIPGDKRSTVKVEATASGPEKDPTAPLSSVTISISAIGTAYGNGEALSIGDGTGNASPLSKAFTKTATTGAATSTVTVTITSETGATHATPSSFHPCPAVSGHDESDDTFKASVSAVASPYTAEAECAGDSSSWFSGSTISDIKTEPIPSAKLHLKGTSSAAASGTAIFTWTIVIKRRLKPDGPWIEIIDQNPPFASVDPTPTGGSETDPH